MAVFDPNLIAALTLRKAVQRSERADDARSRAAGIRRPGRAAIRRANLPPLTPEQLSRLGRIDGLLD
jgi:hypothetical protein